MKIMGKWFLVGLAMLLVSCSSESEKSYVERMSVEHQHDTPVENASAALGEDADITGKEVTYATVNGEEVTGYLAVPEAENAPGIVVIHEWWGLNDNIRMMADKLAAEGYTALAVDLYRGKVAQSPGEAQKYMKTVIADPAAAIENLKQAYQYLSQEQNAEQVGVIGWCFGGGWSLQTALALPQKIDATVIYYGRLVTDPEQLNTLEMPVLAFFGAKDESIPEEQIRQFEAALNEAGVPNSIHIYEGAGHAFANPSGTRYQQKAAEDAWQKTVAFLEEYLKK